ncbi:hypothetical protein [Flavobacterium degerlachei]|jgi:hypothetical protein|uniref:Uncharacterized protein n=1 Tax=Flavobacterium degerlachei TaxID=229203 RepID=A0A1H3EUB7_9FLAO|nr:hypothetical protein [Flavobacterium degerlachei]SDX82205.1 hypothetical protein SAMN05444338_1164 [Flavobacterium degerlachei]
MSQVANCPCCGGKSKIKEKDGEVSYHAIQDEETLNKIGQLKKAMDKFKEKAEALQKELNLLQSIK